MVIYKNRENMGIFCNGRVLYGLFKRKMKMKMQKDLAFEAIAIRDDVAYGSDYKRNSLFKVNMVTGECEYLCLFEREAVNSRRLHCQAVWIDSKIYFIPGAAKNIAVYTPDSNRMEYIEIPCPPPLKYTFYKANFKFIRAIKRENDLWLIPCSYPGIVKLNTLNGQINLYDDWIAADEYFFRLGIYAENNKIIAANGKNNAVLLFDLERERGTIEHVGCNNQGVMSICKAGDVYWFAPRLPGAVIAWNPIINTVEEYDSYPSDFVSGDIVFSFVYGGLEELIFMPAKANKGIILNPKESCIQSFDFQRHYENSTVEYLFETNDERFFRETKGDNFNRFFKISKNGSSTLEYQFYFEDNGDRDKDTLRIIGENNTVVKETRNFGLEDLISGLI